VPTYQPIGTGQSHEGKRGPRAGAKGTQPFRTQHTGLPRTPADTRGGAPAAPRSGPRGKPKGPRR